MGGGGQQRIFLPFAKQYCIPTKYTGSSVLVKCVGSCLLSQNGDLYNIHVLGESARDSCHL